MIQHTNPTPTNQAPTRNVARKVFPPPPPTRRPATEHSRRRRAAPLAIHLYEFFCSASMANTTKWATRCVAVVRAFIRTQHIRILDDITVDAIENYLIDKSTMGNTARTLRNHHTAISSFCQYLYIRNKLVLNPARLVQMRPLDESIPIYLDADEAAQSIEIADENGIGCEVRLALGTGMRLAEIRALAWLDVDLDDRSLLVRRSKSHRARQIPLKASLVETLARHKELYGHLVYVFPGGRGGTGGQGIWDVPRMRGDEWWKKKALPPLQAKIRKFRMLPRGSVGRGWHLFRHTFASKLIQSGLSLSKVAQWLGHKNLDTTRIYAHFAPGYDPDIEFV